MEYLKRRDKMGRLLRSNLRIAMPWARSVIVCALSSKPTSTAPRSIDPAPPDTGWIASYAWSGRTLADGSCAPTDYHDEMLTRLRRIEDELLVRTECTTRCYVDTGPILERALAAEAGIGWIGKNTCLINQQLGSSLLLGVVVTSLLVEEKSSSLAPENNQLSNSLLHSNQENKQVPFGSNKLLIAPDRCGTCTRCIDACPTGALLGAKSANAPRRMDASRCIAYLTIEKKGAIDPSLRASMGRQVFGCEICMDVCPWNRRPLRGTTFDSPEVMDPEETGAPSIPHSLRNGWDSTQLPLQSRPDLINPSLEDLAAMDSREFKKRFKGSPLERSGKNRFLRNVAIAMGNSGKTRFLPQLEVWATGDDPVLAESAQWARQQILSRPCTLLA
jgi:epoxyqueuosine reductase